MLNVYIDEEGRIFEGETAEIMINLEKGLDNMEQFKRQLELEETLKEGKSKLRLFKEGFKDGLKDDTNHRISLSNSVVSAAIGGVIMYAVTKDVKYSAKAAFNTGAKTYVLGRIQCAVLDGVFETFR